MARATPTRIEIDLQALRHNFEELRSRIGKKQPVIAVVKSNAYGHGAVPVARTLQGLGADRFAVGTVDEGVQLREAGIQRPILILLGLIEGKFSELLRYQLTPVVYRLDLAQQLHQFLAGRGVSLDLHVKIDTGMTRLGVRADQAPAFFDQLKKLNTLRPVGLLTHLADAEEVPFSNRQAAAFDKARGEFQKRFPKVALHMANSLAAVDNRYPYDMVRLGIVLYGAYPTLRQRRLLKLKPVMNWKSQLALIKNVPKGTAVGYGRTFITRRTSRIGIIPVGYADGYLRALSNRASVLVKGVRVPVVGRVSMDLTTIDLTKLPLVREGDEVTLLGQQGKKSITAEELGEWAGTISYEIFCRVAERVPHLYLPAK